MACSHAIKMKFQLVVVEDYLFHLPKNKNLDYEEMELIFFLGDEPVTCFWVELHSSWGMNVGYNTNGFWFRKEGNFGLRDWLLLA